MASSTVDLAFPGYSGLLNVPSAFVLKHGQGDFQVSDQAIVRGEYGYYKNFSGGVGLYDHIEVGGRIAWAETQSNCFRTGCGGIRDLSINAKARIPFIPDDWFSVALGVQDLGGEVNFFDATYGVVGRRFGPVELNLGYGQIDTARVQPGPRYLDGVFGGAVYRPTEWLQLIGEYDGVDTRAGIGVSTPEDWLPAGMRVKTKVLAYDRGDTASDRHFVSIGLSIPFGELRKPSEPKTAVLRARNDVEPAQGSASKSDPVVARQVGQALASAGYERVRTISEGDTLRIEAENNVYNRNERDALHDIAQRVRDDAGEHARVNLTLLNQGLPILEQEIALGDAAESSGESYVAQAWSKRTLFNPQPDPEWDFEGGSGPAWRPRLTLAPSISSGVATEYGVWDASVGILSELSTNLWPGALASVSYNTEVARSDDFEPGGVFYEDRQRNGLIEAEVQQAFKLHPQVLAVIHGGRYARNFHGALGEAVWVSGRGDHVVGVVGGQFVDDRNSDNERYQSLLRYTYYNSSLDLQLKAWAGRFFEEDDGFRLESRIWFGDNALILGYRNTNAEFLSLGWSMPLTPRKDHQFKYLQVRGDVDWSYQVQTRINEDTNDTAFGGAAVVESANPIDQLYLNRGRFFD
ncbi:MAG: YjbH domain-containing protein [Pseudomonadota bacterium]